MDTTKLTGRVAGPIVAALAALGLLLAPAPSARADSEPDVFALTTANRLLTFNESRPDRILADVAITGLAEGERLLGIDVRPANGRLYAVSSASQLYTIDPSTGAAAPSGAPLDPALDYSDAIGIDFNPVVDRLRIVTDNGQNLRVNVDTGAVADNDPVQSGVQPDGALAFAAGDRNAGAAPSVVAAAYTENFAGATATVLYVIDSELDILATQNPPNAGALNSRGGLQIDASELAGFDIFTDEDGNNARAVFRPSGGGQSNFYTVDLSSGRARMKSKGAIGGGGQQIQDIAIAAN
jgi:outer membrane protein assembly factor BamB